MTKLALSGPFLGMFSRECHAYGNGVMDSTHAIEALRSLTADDIRLRLAELEAESQCLRTLLRAALARERAQARLTPRNRTETSAH